jgi:putative ABC transport system ATP-binding protein
VAVDVAGRRILHDVDLRVPADGITAAVGASGAGKSTLTRLCNRLIDPSEGIVRFRGRDVREVDVLTLRHAVGMVYQQSTVFDGTVADNLAVTGAATDRWDGALESVGPDPAGFLERDASTRSGGEAQRLCLARTLLVDPQILAADEPTASLDAESARVFEDLARRIADGGVPVLWVTHDAGQVDRIADRRVHLADGTVVR